MMVLSHLNDNNTDNDGDNNNEHNDDDQHNNNIKSITTTLDTERGNNLILQSIHSTANTHL